MDAVKHLSAILLVRKIFELEENQDEQYMFKIFCGKVHHIYHHWQNKLSRHCVSLPTMSTFWTKAKFFFNIHSNQRCQMITNFINISKCMMNNAFKLFQEGFI